MANETNFILIPSSEIDVFLSDNSTDMVELLHGEGIHVEQRKGTNPISSTESREKDPVAIIVASAAAALAIVPALSRILSAITHKTVVVNEMVLVPVEDSSGKTVKDKTGNPILQWVERTSILESAQVQPQKAKVDVKGPVGLQISYSEK